MLHIVRFSRIGGGVFSPEKWVKLEELTAAAERALSVIFLVPASLFPNQARPPLTPALPPPPRPQQPPTELEEDPRPRPQPQQPEIKTRQRRTRLV